MNRQRINVYRITNRYHFAPIMGSQTTSLLQVTELLEVNYHPRDGALYGTKLLCTYCVIFELEEVILIIMHLIIFHISNYSMI